MSRIVGSHTAFELCVLDAHHTSGKQTPASRGVAVCWARGDFTISGRVARIVPELGAPSVTVYSPLTRHGLHGQGALEYQDAVLQ